jgi:hypothetical protein
MLIPEDRQPACSRYIGTTGHDLGQSLQAFMVQQVARQNGDYGFGQWRDGGHFDVRRSPSPAVSQMLGDVDAVSGCEHEPFLACDCRCIDHPPPRIPMPWTHMQSAMTVAAQCRGSDAMIVAFRMKAEPLTPSAYLAVGWLDQATGIFEPLEQLPTSPTLDAVKPVVWLQQGITAPRLIALWHPLRFS